MGQKVGGGCCVPSWGAGSLSYTMSPGIRPTSVPTKWHLDPSSRLATTHMDRKLGAVPLWGNGCLSNTMWPGSRSTSVPSGILIHPSIWPQYTDNTDRQRSDSIRRTAFIARRFASAVLATAIPSVCPSVRPSVRHTPVLCQTTACSTCSLHCQIAKCV